MGSLQGGISKLSKLDTVLEKGKVIIPCKFCGREGVFMDVPTRLVAGDAMTRGLVWNLKCIYCGGWLSRVPGTYSNMSVYLPCRS
jgi:hypothetical protein